MAARARRIAVTLLLALLESWQVAAAGEICKSGADEPPIPDPGLRAAFREQLDLAPHVLLTCAKAETMSRLDAAGRRVASLAGIEAATGLATIDLRDNELADLGPLADLAARQVAAWPAGCAPEPQTGRGRATKLLLGGNDIDSLDGLAGLGCLETLDLSDNQIELLGPLKELARLSALDLSENAIQEVSPLSQLKSLTSLELAANEIEDVSPLRHLTKLTTLNLSGNYISSLEALVANPGLQNSATVNLESNCLELIGVEAQHLRVLVEDRYVKINVDDQRADCQPPASG